MNLHPVRIVYVLMWCKDESVIENWDWLFTAATYWQNQLRRARIFWFCFFFFFRWKYKKQIRLFWIARSSFCIANTTDIRQSTLKRQRHAKHFLLSDTAIHSEGFEFGVHWITDGKSASNTSSLLSLTVSLCFLLPSTNDNKSPLWSWCRPPGWHFHPQHPSSNTEKHIVLTDSMSSFPLWFTRRFWIHSFTPVLCRFVSLFFFSFSSMQWQFSNPILLRVCAHQHKFV